jgi:hypothetical protein
MQISQQSTIAISIDLLDTRKFGVTGCRLVQFRRLEHNANTCRWRSLGSLLHEWQKSQGQNEVRKVVNGKVSFKTILGNIVRCLANT